MHGFYRFVEDHSDTYLKDLQALLREPSIFSNTIGLNATVTLLTQYLERAGCRVARYSAGDGQPLLAGEIGDEGPVLLFYGHYDVQPVEPLNQWEYGPFMADIHNGYLYARGVADGKGNLYARLAAVETYRRVFGKLPCRIRFLLDGEEEVGSPGISGILQEHPELLEADLCVWDSGYIDKRTSPSITFGVKGLAYLELRCKSLRSDLHSSWASIVDNPAWRLLHALATIRTQEGQITIDGMREQLDPPTSMELELLQDIDPDITFFRDLYGIKDFIPPADTRSLMERYFFSPTCNICGIHSGYSKTETKTVLPNEAWANMDFRLIPNLTPEGMVELLRQHFDRRQFNDIEIRLKSGLAGYRCRPGKPILDWITAASRDTFHSDPVFMPMLSASGPMSQICAPKRLPVISFGVAHPGAHIHAPNENIRIHDFICSIKFIGRIINLFAGTGPAS